MSVHSTPSGSACAESIVAPLTTDQFVAETARDWTPTQLTFAMRLILRAIQVQKGHAKMSAAKLEVLERTGKSKDSMKVWLSYSKSKTNIPWPLVDLLRIEYGILYTTRRNNIDVLPRGIIEDIVVQLACDDSADLAR